MASLKLYHLLGLKRLRSTRILGLQFYIIGVLLILLGIVGIFSGEGVSKVASILIIILGIVAFALGGTSLTNPLFAAILIGVALIIQGIRLYISEWT